MSHKFRVACFTSLLLTSAASIFAGSPRESGAVAATLRADVPPPLRPRPDWKATDECCFSVGYSVATAGDVNGDGYDDVIVGTLDFFGGGQAFVYYGSPSGLSRTPDWTGEGDEQFGFSVGSA